MKTIVVTMNRVCSACVTKRVEFSNQKPVWTEIVRLPGSGLISRDRVAVSACCAQHILVIAHKACDMEERDQWFEIIGQEATIWRD